MGTPKPTRAEKSLVAERTRLQERMRIAELRVETFADAIEKVNAALLALGSSEAEVEEVEEEEEEEEEETEAAGDD